MILTGCVLIIGVIALAMVLLFGDLGPSMPFIGVLGIVGCIGIVMLVAGLVEASRSLIP